MATSELSGEQNTNARGAQASRALVFLGCCAAEPVAVVGARACASEGNAVQPAQIGLNGAVPGDFLGLLLLFLVLLLLVPVFGLLGGLLALLFACFRTLAVQVLAVFCACCSFACLGATLGCWAAFGFVLNWLWCCLLLVSLAGAAFGVWSIVAVWRKRRARSASTDQMKSGHVERLDASQAVRFYHEGVVSDSPGWCMSKTCATLGGLRGSRIANAGGSPTRCGPRDRLRRPGCRTLTGTDPGLWNTTPSA